MDSKYDFSGWATRWNVRCSDGRTIRPNAFSDNDGKSVPLVWNHDHNSPDNVLGHADLVSKPEGMYAYCYLNDTDSGQATKQIIQHGDVAALSIYANKLSESNGIVAHGLIREVSVVLAGANPGAYIDDIMEHSEDGLGSAIIYSGEDIMLSHSDEPAIEAPAEDASNNIMHAEEKSEEKEATVANSGGDKTVQDVFDTLTDEQKDAVYIIVAEAVNQATGDDDEEDEDVKHNVFDDDYETGGYISHAELMEDVMRDVRSGAHLGDAILAHADDYGIRDIDQLFPDYEVMDTPPEFIKRDTGWVDRLMGKVHHTPFSRIKSRFADITEDEARAKGYIKGNMKKNEVFTLLKRTTSPTTVYKKQKFDRDDLLDITDFDVVNWVRSEMRVMLDEELARAILIGDGRQTSSEDKIKEDCIRPIWTDDDLFTIKTTLKFGKTDSEDAQARAMIKGIIKARKDYKGSGNPTLFTTEDVLTQCLLIEDTTGRRLYNNVQDVATAMRVSDIVTVEVMENQTRTIKVDGADQTVNLMGILVNPADYNVGTDKGGQISMFDDFDIDYNQQKYLLETRCSGALIKPYSAIAIESYVAA